MSKILWSCLVPLALAAQDPTTYVLPSGAVILEKQAIPDSVKADRALLLWLI